MTYKRTPKFLNAEMAGPIVQHVLNLTVMSDKMNAVFKRTGVGHIVILVPAMHADHEVGSPEWHEHKVRPHVLYECSVGDEKEWEFPFKKIAHNKALQLWQNRNSDGNTDSNAHLLMPGDTPYWGGVARHGMVVAFSGVQPWFDQMISGMVADMLKAYAREAFVKSADNTQGLNFLE